MRPVALKLFIFFASYTLISQHAHAKAIVCDVVNELNPAKEFVFLGMRGSPWKLKISDTVSAVVLELDKTNPRSFGHYQKNIFCGEGGAYKAQTQMHPIKVNDSLMTTSLEGTSEQYSSEKGTINFSFDVKQNFGTLACTHSFIDGDAAKVNETSGLLVKNCMAIEEKGTEADLIDPSHLNWKVIDLVEKQPGYATSAFGSFSKWLHPATAECFTDSFINVIIEGYSEGECRVKVKARFSLNGTEASAYLASSDKMQGDQLVINNNNEIFLDREQQFILQLRLLPKGNRNYTIEPGTVLRKE